MPSVLSDRRCEFHKELVRAGALSISGGVASNADSSQPTSRAIAGYIAVRLQAGITERKLPGQSAGKAFEAAVASFITSTFPLLRNLRPGNWDITNTGSSRSEDHLAKYEPYTHLDDLALAVVRDQTLRSVLGNAYSISSDVLVIRQPEPDNIINNAVDGSVLVDSTSGNRTIIRSANQPYGIVHAVVSCKWTLRSDRAQNARSEALNIIRNRKGRTPHIVVVTGEPTPSRLASLALGTGDIDMVYHFALPELIEAVAACRNDEAQAMLTTLLDGNRLRDIADLPLDLCV